MKSLLSLLLAACLALPGPVLARSTKVIPMTKSDLAARLKGKDAILRLADGSKVAGKVSAADADGVTIKPRRKPARTIGWSEVTLVDGGFTRTTKALAGGMLVGSMGTVALVASGAPPQRHPLENVAIGLLAGGFLALLFGPSIAYQPR